MLVARTAVPPLLVPELERLVVAVLREVELPEVLPVERRVWSFWFTVPVEREVVEEPVERRVWSFWFTVPAERVVVEPVLRLVCAEEVRPAERLVEPVLRFVRSFCAKEERPAEALAERLAVAPVERPIEAPEEREGAIEPVDRLAEEDPRVVVWEEDDRDAVWEPPERRAWAFASGAAIIAMATTRAAMELIILFMALLF